MIYNKWAYIELIMCYLPISLYQYSLLYAVCMIYTRVGGFEHLSNFHIRFVDPTDSQLLQCG